MARISKTELIELQKKLRTDAKIAERFGITRQAVNQLRQKYGIEAIFIRHDERNAEIIKLYNGGKPGTALAKKYGLSLSQTYRIINEMKAAAKKEARKISKKRK